MFELSVVFCLVIINVLLYRLFRYNKLTEERLFSLHDRIRPVDGARERIRRLEKEMEDSDVSMKTLVKSNNEMVREITAIQERYKKVRTRLDLYGSKIQSLVDERVKDGTRTSPPA